MDGRGTGFRADWAAGVRGIVSCCLLSLAGLTSPVLARAEQMPRAEIEAADGICIECHTDLAGDDGRFEFPDGAVLSFEVDPQRLRTSVHGQILSCLSCHDGYEDRHFGFPRESARLYAQARSTMCVGCHEDVNHRSHSGAGAGAPICTDCHSAHADPPMAKAVAQLSRRCGSCHPQALADLSSGGHAASVNADEPNGDVPGCTTCHPANVGSRKSPQRMRLAAAALCIDCHSRDLLIGRYDLPQKASESYMKDFHGTTAQFLWRHPTGTNQPDVMVCHDCHRFHKVEALDRGELAGVCRNCHADADERLAGAWLGHQPPGPGHAMVLWAVQAAYYAFIPLVLGGLLINIVLDLRRLRRLSLQAAVADLWGRLRERFATWRGGLTATSTDSSLTESSGGFGKGENSQSPALDRYVLRFSLIERLEHLIAMVLFAALVLTGLPQSYPGSSLGHWFVGLWGGIMSTRLIHCVAGYSFVALLVFHVLRGAIGAIRQQSRLDMIPRSKDFQDAWQSLKYCLGQAPRPKAGRFDYRAKFEYWGLFLGGSVMTATGFMLMFPDFVVRFLPGIVLVIARVVHGLEATLAVLVVIVWHLYGVLLRPEIFPCDTSIFTGKISRDRMRHEHELEYDRLIAEGRLEPELETVGSAGEPA